MASTKGTSKRVRPGTFGARLRAARERAGLSADDAARKMRVATSTFYSWETNDRKPRRLVRLAKVVSSSIAELFGEAAS